MLGLESEIMDIPESAVRCFEENKKMKLPIEVFYLGMGSSYYAPLTLFYAAQPIFPQIASEYANYLSTKTETTGVLISQSGESSETLWCAKLFKNIITITNNPKSSLAQMKNVSKNIDITAGTEKYSSTKTYINTLLCLYIGLGFNPQKALEALRVNFSTMKKLAEEEAQKVYSYIKNKKAKSFYIVGSGPNIGTAYEGALTLSETTKLTWVSLPVAQYDHGPKETADGSVVVILNSQGKDLARIKAIKKLLNKKSNAHVAEMIESKLPEVFSPITLITKLNFFMNKLADLLEVGNTFNLGGKVTTFQKP